MLNKPIYIGAAICLALTALGAVVAMMLREGSAWDGVLPELFGFSVEGLILVLLFSLYQQNRERKKQNDRSALIQKAALDSIELLRFWCTHPEEAEKFDVRNMSPQEIVEKLWEGGEIEICARKFVPEVAQALKDAAHSLNPLVGTISAQHLSAWIMVGHSVSALAEPYAEDWELNQRILSFLKNRKTFEVLAPEDSA